MSYNQIAESIFKKLIWLPESEEVLFPLFIEPDCEFNVLYVPEKQFIHIINGFEVNNIIDGRPLDHLQTLVRNKLVLYAKWITGVNYFNSLGYEEVALMWPFDFRIEALFALIETIKKNGTSDEYQQAAHYELDLMVERRTSLKYINDDLKFYMIKFEGVPEEHEYWNCLDVFISERIKYFN